MLKKKIAVIALMMLLISASVSAGGYEKGKAGKKAAGENLYKEIELFSDAVSIVRSDYVDSVDSKKMIYGAMKGMLSSLDDFSQFMEPDEYNEIQIEAKGEFGGIGIEISLKDGILTIITPIAGTPGEAAGLMPEDKIVKIDGVITKGITLNDAVKKMRGKPGTMVTLTIWREKDEKILDVAIKRDTIKIQSVKKALIIEDRIGYIKLAEFQENTPRDLEDMLKRLEKEGMNSLILDVRNNPGGLLNVAVDVAEKFLPKDTTIVSIKSRKPEESDVFKSRGIAPLREYPLVILVNEGSASASEILAGAIQDNKRGVIIGKKTFGKASVQTVIPLKDGSALRLTTASYLTPNGKMIRGEGITPDIVVEKEEPAPGKEDKTKIFDKLEMKEKKAKEPPVLDGGKLADRDNQLNRAIDLMKSIKIYRAAHEK